MLSNSAKIAYNLGYRIKWNSVYSPYGKKLKLDFCHVYPRIKVFHKGRKINVKVHQLSAWQRYGSRCYGKKIVIRHDDDNVKNIRPSNMLLGTMADNYMDMHRNRYLKRKAA